MCNHYRPASNEKQIEVRFAAIPQVPLGEYQMLNGFDHPETPVILDTSPNVVSLGKWGLIPAYAKDEKLFYKSTTTLNARIETLHERVTYKDYVDNRCLVLADAIKEWKHVMDGRKKIKIPYEIKTKDNQPFAMAAIYSYWHGQLTFTILMTEANELMAEIHNSAKRMPVILLPEEEKLWLNRERLEPYHNRTEVELLATPI